MFHFYKQIVFINLWKIAAVRFVINRRKVPAVVGPPTFGIIIFRLGGLVRGGVNLRLEPIETFSVYHPLSTAFPISSSWIILYPASFNPTSASSASVRAWFSV